MYLPMLLYLGITKFVNVAWSLLLFSVSFLLVAQVVVRREENYLERRFGDHYGRYRARVPRLV